MRSAFLVSLLFFISTCSHAYAAASSPQLGTDGSCRLLGLFPFSDERVHLKGANDPLPPARMTAIGLSYSASMIMAMQHFNDRNPVVVEELSLEPLLQECPVYFPFHQSKVADSALDYKRSVEIMMTEIATYKSNINNDGDENNNMNPSLCSVIGPSDELSVESTAFLTSSLNIPLVAYAATGMWMTTERIYPTSLRTTANDQIYVAQIVSYLQYTGRDHLVVIHQGSDKMTRPSLYLERAALAAGIKVVLQVIAPPPPGTPTGGTKHFVDAAMANVKKTGYKTIMLMYDTPGAGWNLAYYAHQNGLLKDDYMWLVHSDFASADTIHYHFDLDNYPSYMDKHEFMPKLLHGATIISRLDGFQYDSQNDRFLAAWKGQPESSVELLNAALPTTTTATTTFASKDYFQAQTPVEGSSYVYDSVMAVGIGACRAWAELQDKNQTENMDTQQQQSSQGGGGSPLDLPLSHTWGISTATFMGASGAVSFGGSRQPNTRSSKGLFVGAFNVRINLDETTNRTIYTTIMTSRRKGEGPWEEIPGTSFLYKDGSSMPPTVQQEISNENYLSSWVRIIGFSLMGVTFFLGLGSCIVVTLMRKDRAITPTQPLFQVLLCAGSVVMSTSIFTLSFDEKYGWGTDQLDIACIITPWLFFLGHTLVYLALFVKMWRINKVLQFRRRNVKLLHVLWPLFLMLAVVVIILVLWTVLDPWTWERDFLTELPPVRYGQCNSDKTNVFFGLLAGTMVLTTALAVFMAWKTRDISDMLTESKGLFYALCSQMQAWCVGLPILAVLEDGSTDAVYLGRVLLISIFALCPMLIITGPKVYGLIRNKYFSPLSPPAEQSKSRGNILMNGTTGVHVSGLSMPIPSNSNSLRKKNDQQEDSNESSTASNSKKQGDSRQS